MNVAFIILWLIIGSIFLIRVFLLNKAKGIFMNKNHDYNFFSTNIILGNIPKLPMKLSKVQSIRKQYYNLSIILYVLLFINFILLVVE